MRTNLKEKTISEGELFSVLFLCRFSSLIITKEINFLHLLYESVLSILLVFIAYLVYKRANFSSYYIKIPVAVLCAFSACLTFYSILDFKENAISLGISSLFIFITVFLCAFYSAYLGAQAFSRFAPVCFVIVLSACAVGMLSVMKSVDINEFESVNDESGFAVSLLKCFDVPAVFLALSNSVKSNHKRALTLSLLGSFGVALLLYSVCAFVLKKAVVYYPYPVFTLFQLGEIGTYNKLDMLFTSPFLTAAFIKLSALFYGVIKVIK